MGEGVDFAVELGPTPAHILFWKDRGLEVGKLTNGRLKGIRDGAKPKFRSRIADNVSAVPLRAEIVFGAMCVHCAQSSQWE